MSTIIETDVDVKGEAYFQLENRIKAKTARFGVIGLGYVGLPLALTLSEAGFDVTGIDIDTNRVDAIVAGRSYITDVTDEELQKATREKRLRATTHLPELRNLDAVNICVPTPLRKTKDPDMSYVVSATDAIAEHLHPGLLVMLESTTYPGTTDELLLPKLEATGLKVGHDFFLCFSPERVDPGNPNFNTRNIPKVVGGITPVCTEVAVRLYRQRLEQVIPVSSPQVAEMVKLLENTFRSVNIGLVNELALMCERLKIDVWEVIGAAATKPFGFMPFYPGPGLGGHCIPIDPFYLSWKARASGFEARFIELAGYVNGQMPDHVVNLVAQSLNRRGHAVHGSRILVLGVAYKADIDDTRESPSIDIMETLRERGARIEYSDPYVPTLQFGGKRLRSLPLTPARLRRFDCVVIATAHKAFPYAAVLRH